MPRSTPDEFFDTREDWSRRKHLLLEHYLPPAAAKLRSVSPDRRVLVLDGFAGRGRYTDGSPGSPVHMGELANKVRAWHDPVDLRVHNVESDPSNHVELQMQTARWVQQGVMTNYRSTFNHALPTVLNEARSSPLFAFLDPFRPTDLPLSDIRPLLVRSSITELLIVFHTPAILRIIGQVMPNAGTDNKTRESSGKRLDAIFGGCSWKRFLDEEANPATVVDCFRRELSNLCEMEGHKPYILDHAIQARQNIGLKYHVLLVTRHAAGVRLINDAFVKEREDVQARATLAETTGTLFEEVPEEIVLLREAELEHKEKTRQALLYIGRKRKADCTFGDLLLDAMTRWHGKCTEAQYRQAMRELLDRAIAPRFIGIHGNRLKNGKWKVEDSLRVRTVLQ